MNVGAITPTAIPLPHADPVVRFDVQTTRTLSVTDTKDDSVFTFGGNLDLDTRTIPSCDLAAFEEDFFNAIYFIPATASLSSVSSDVIVPVQVFNAFRDTRTILARTVTGDAGIILEGPDVGFELLPLGLYEYEVEVSPAGPPDIDFSFTIDVTGDAGASFTLTGQRSTPFFFLPNWQDGIQRIFSFRTDIARGRTQREARRRIRSRPRIRFSYQHLARDTKQSVRSRLSEFFNFMQDDPSRLATMPDWAASAQTVGDVAPGDSTVNLSGSRRWARAGELVFIFNRSTDNLFLSLIEESANGNTQIELQSVQAEVIPAGSIVYRAVSGRVAQRISGNMLTDSIADMTVEFAVDPGQENLAPVPAATQFFQGREIFDVQENWATPPSIEFAQDRIVLDTGFGRIEDETLFEHTPEVWQLNFSGLDLDEIEVIEDFFMRMEGRAGEFWRSKRLPDFQLAQQVFAGQASLTVEQSRIADIYRDDLSHVAIELQTRSGQIFRRAIIAMDIPVDTDTTVISFNEPFPDDIAIEDVKRVSWLQLWRLASDDLTVNWSTDSVANIRLSMLSLIVEAPE